MPATLAAAMVRALAPRPSPIPTHPSTRTSACATLATLAQAATWLILAPTSACPTHARTAPALARPLPPTDHSTRTPAHASMASRASTATSPTAAAQSASTADHASPPPLVVSAHAPTPTPASHARRSSLMRATQALASTVTVAAPAMLLVVRSTATSASAPKVSLVCFAR